MKLVKFTHRYDFGHDYNAQILNVKGWSLFQLSLTWSDFKSWPYIQIKSGTGTALGILFWAYRFGLDFEFISHTWNFDYLDKIADDEAH